MTLSTRRRAVIAVLLVCLGASAAAAAGASAQIEWRVCHGANNFACGSLAVPLDPSGKYAGTVTLAIRRRRAPVGHESTAIIGLAGGPGQAAIPFAGVMAQVMAPALGTRDLIVFDQRGTGASGALQCKSLQQVSFVSLSPASQIGACARELGKARDFYSTSDSVADIEAIRKAAGYSKLILYGTSYGTWVAMAYARAYPQYTAGLVLDSTLPPSGPQLFSQSTFQALPHVLQNLCSGGACAQVSAHPYRDLVELVDQLHRSPLTATEYNPHGRPYPVQIDESDLIEALINGDLDLNLRAGFPAATVSALHGDDAPLGTIVSGGNGGGGGSDGVDNALYFATSCEDDSFPWQRTATEDQRLAQATANLDTLPRNAFAPFDLETALSLSNAPQCIAWPSAGQAAGEPTATATATARRPLPHVPTLIFSGAEDLRTPTENARAMAAQIPGADLVVVGHTGHSVLTTTNGSCAEKAVKAFFDKQKVPQCWNSPRGPFDRPTAVDPASLAAVAPARGIAGNPGRTVAAVQLTIKQVDEDLIESIEGDDVSSLLSTTDLGGLRGGWAALSAKSGLALHAFSYVPGVTVTGKLTPGSLLTIGGAAATHGTLRYTTSRGLQGTLDGVPVSVH